MTIQWYPGHMKKARDGITEAVNRVDVVIEMLDARLPGSSRNPVIDELKQGKPCVRILNKTDLADPDVTPLWLREFGKDPLVTAIDVMGHDQELARTLPELCRKLAGYPVNRPVRAMVVGIPNVGKSTVINTLSRRKVAKVGNQPAVTRQQQTVTIPCGDGSMYLLDTPGILWPNLENKNGAYRLAASGAIRDGILDFQDVALFTCDFLLRRYPRAVEERFKLKSLPGSPLDLLETVGVKRGCLMKGGRLDMYKASEILILDLRSGKLGPISLESPGDDDLCPSDP